MSNEMKANERFLAALKGEPIDRLPITEIAFWWSDTVNRWLSEGLPKNYNYCYQFQDVIDLQDYFGIDMLAHWWVKPYTNETPFGEYGMGMVKTEEEYEKKLLPTLYPDSRMDHEFIKRMKELKSQGKITTELIINGAFWEPREYFGIEDHLFSFYDNQDLYKRMVNDMLNWQKKVIDYASNTLEFDIVTIAEDMSYNNGPMLSEEMFFEFMAPYYREIIPYLEKANIFPIVDSDGDISSAIRWFNDVGVKGYLPLERQSGLDMVELQALYPNTAFVGHYDKMVMHKGEKALRDEFERLLPCVKQGKYLISCDHQTPPSVCLEDYKLYIKLFKEYALLAVN